MAVRIPSNERQACISATQSADGNILTILTEINTAFSHFYEKLYTSEIKSNRDKYKYFPNNLNLKKLSCSEAAAFGVDISLKELWDAVCDMSLGKSPCPNGIPIEFYVKFWPELGPMLLKMITTLINTTS